MGGTYAYQDREHAGDQPRDRVTGLAQSGGLDRNLEALRGPQLAPGHARNEHVARRPVTKYVAKARSY